MCVIAMSLHVGTAALSALCCLHSCSHCLHADRSSEGDAAGVVCTTFSFQVPLQQLLLLHLPFITNLHCHKSNRVCLQHFCSTPVAANVMTWLLVCTSPKALSMQLLVCHTHQNNCSFVFIPGIPRNSSSSTAAGTRSGLGLTT